MVAFIATIVTFVTWLTLSLTDVGRNEQIGASALVFFAVGGTLVHYVLSCMRRHRTQTGQARQ
ncbi:hypothetical protein [Thioflavicoccus mobilis]|nr:hypothetical protein [Thioflavicoccus mobilis]